MSIGEHRKPELAVIEAELCQQFARYFASGGTIEVLKPGAHALELRCKAVPELDEYAVVYTHAALSPTKRAKQSLDLSVMREQARQASRYAYETARQAGKTVRQAQTKGAIAYKSMMAVQKRALKNKRDAV